MGLLLLIPKSQSGTYLSNDFLEIVRLRKLPKDWNIHLKDTKDEFRIRTGIIVYHPQGKIDWVDTVSINGISSFDELLS